MVEECLEASLSRLQRAARMELTSHTVDSFSKLYGTLGPTSQTPHNASTPNLSDVFPHQVLLCLQRMIDSVRLESLRHVRMPSAHAKYAQTSAAWPATTEVPMLLYHQLSQT